jgi:hypothetical protein
MKKLIIPFFSIVAIIYSCESDSNNSTGEYCGDPTGQSVEDAKGEIRSFNNGSYVIYFIGSLDDENPGPGYIPCNYDVYTQLSTQLGKTIVYSGEYLNNNQSDNGDPYDPYYTGIDISEFVIETD